MKGQIISRWPRERWISRKWINTFIKTRSNGLFYGRLPRSAEIFVELEND